MSTPRAIRRARKGWPIGFADPEDDDPEDDDFPDSLEEVEEIEPDYVDDDDYAASRAEDRWIADRDRTASQ